MPVDPRFSIHELSDDWPQLLNTYRLADHLFHTNFLGRLFDFIDWVGGHRDDWALVSGLLLAVGVAVPDTLSQAILN